MLVRYRSDIDGLRAIAVLAVVFFHLLRRGLPGGYLGVDIFFVLSGYLITGIIWRELRQDSFSIVRFYDRRIRRIMPALLLLLTVATLIAAMVLLPTDLRGYSKSLLACLFFVANVYFWRDTDYFSTAAEQKPLLHIWTLGVEEQFYILFPLMLLLLVRWWRHRALHALVVLTMASLGANVVALSVGADLPAFFLLPTRAWELGLGAIVSLLPPRVAVRAMTPTILATGGVLLIGVDMAHPLDSYWYVPVALPATIGTSMLLLAGQYDRSIISRTLGLRPLAFIGLISYSLYLWHWPIIVLSRYYLVREFTVRETVALLGLMLSCAIGSWWFVERPFRSKAMPIAVVRIATCGGVALLAAAAAAMLAARGLPGRLSTEAAVINQAIDTNYRCPISDYLEFGGSRACTMNLKSREPADADVILLGNSHAQMYAPLWISVLAERGLNGLLVPVNGCLPTVKVNISKECIRIARENLNAISHLARARTVIIGLTWEHAQNALVDRDGRTIGNEGDRALEDAIDDLIARITGIGKHVVLIGPIAEPGWDVASILSRELAFGRAHEHKTFLPTSNFSQRFEVLIRHFEARTDMSFVRPDKVQCPADRCYYVIGGRSLFSDSNHLASAELQRFRKEFAAALSNTAMSPTRGVSD